MNELNNLIDLALEKAKQDLNNEKKETLYTPEFLIELLEEIKEVANPKPKAVSYPKDEFEIAKREQLLIEYGSSDKHIEAIKAFTRS